VAGGITPKQAAYVRAFRGQLGEPERALPRSKAQATREIERLLARRDGPPAKAEAPERGSVTGRRSPVVGRRRRRGQRGCASSATSRTA
jgi:hypothetical protein